jgi:hypothetical protein
MKNNPFSITIQRKSRSTGYKILRTTDTSDPFGPVIDPATGRTYDSLDAATPAGWEEAFRCEYLPGARRARGFRAHVDVFPHEVVLVDPSRYTVVHDASRSISLEKSIGAGTCVPAWVVPV